MGQASFKFKDPYNIMNSDLSIIDKELNLRILSEQLEDDILQLEQREDEQLDHVSGLKGLIMQLEKDKNELNQQINQLDPIITKLLQELEQLKEDYNQIDDREFLESGNYKTVLAILFACFAFALMNHYILFLLQLVMGIIVLFIVKFYFNKKNDRENLKENIETKTKEISSYQSYLKQLNDEKEKIEHELSQSKLKYDQANDHLYELNFKRNYLTETNRYLKNIHLTLKKKISD
jgi:ABC-type bacteriocin/lantibiotic exporter with double-glycine peptidase domain